jgi:hypothetical protein
VETVGNQALIAAKDGTALYGLLFDEGLAFRLDPATAESRTLDIGALPARLTGWKGRLLATVRGERALVVLEDQGGELVEVDRVEVGAEPLGVVATADGERVFVALHAHDAVLELDGELDVVRTLPAAGRPSWLALHPSESTLYVASHVGALLTWFDLEDNGATSGVVPLPPVLGAGHDNDLYYTPRLTGDPAVRPDGSLLAVPALWVDNTSPPRRSPEEQAEIDPAQGYERIGLGLSPMNPGVALMELDAATGRPSNVVRLRYATTESGPVDPAQTQVLRGFIAAVSWSPDGAVLTAALENSRVVLALDVDRSSPDSTLSDMETGPVAAVISGDGPRAVAWVGQEAWFLNTFSLDMSSVSLLTLSSELDAQDTPWLEGTPTLVATTEAVVTPPLFDDTLSLGRLLFSTSVYPQMATPAAGVSCSTCHFDSREDGLNWPDFDTVPRQTRSLAGAMSLTPPYTWTEPVPTVAEEARITSQVRLGGRNATQDELDAVAAWIEHTPDVDHPLRGATSDVIERGRAIFERADVGCAGCHPAPLYTNLQSYPLFGFDAVDTPSLVGIAATAPYLHDGTATTLRAVLERARDGSMGYTGDLDEQELADLESFLRSL